MPASIDPVVRSPDAALSRSASIALVLLFALIWFSNLDYRRLIHPDEGRYAEIPREMVASGDWLTPRLDGIKYFEKPALQYWLTAAAYEAFGIHQWTARLWPALAGFAGVLFIGYVGFRLGGPRLALYSAAALGGCIWYALNAHILTLDSGLTLWMSVGFGALLLAQRSAAAEREQRMWMLIAWSALALAVLSKGLIGVVLPGASLFVYSLLTRDWVVWRRLHLFGGLLLFALIAAPWFIAVSLANPEFFRFFFIHEHFERFLTNEHHREGAWWYFVPIFAGGILPWLTVLAWTAPRLWSRAAVDSNGFSWQRFALVWSAFIFVFFSMSSSKLPSYILPIFPALALVIGVQLATLPERTLIWLTLPLVVVTGACMLAIGFGFETIAQRFADERQPLAPLLAYRPWLTAACAVALAGGVAALWWLKGGKRTAAILAVALTTLTAALLVLTGHDELADSRSAAPILSRVVSQYGPIADDVPFYSVKMYDQTLPWYLGRTVTPVAHLDELAMGLAIEPDKAVATLGEWKQRWDRETQAYAIMQVDMYEMLLREGVPMRELGRDPRRVIVSRR
ncbi:MAG TPA: glycosyltransferase family 39 protein [Casimicrobiaceae bacterium]|jgi:4-amino-4-deoxy-L-arabinose transferase-like glycosyltransferase|nr:glycosyltransferase family 39 protein [Casimicrobiaceae bacterium]